MSFMLFGRMVSTYMAMFVVGAVLMVILCAIRAKLVGVGLLKGLVLGLVLVAGGYFGVKGLYMLENPSAHFSWRGGMSLFGSVFAVPVFVAVAAPLLRVEYRRCMDLVAMFGPWMFAFMRVGCYFEGCCGGSIDFLPPVQLMECVLDLLLCGFLLWLEWKEKRFGSGKQYPTFMVGYAAIRFVLEFLRDTPKDKLFLSNGQWFAILSFIIGASLLYIIRRRERK